MKQLPLPISQSTFEQLFNKAKQFTNYCLQHPSDVLLAITLILLIDIENDIDELGE